MYIASTAGWNPKYSRLLVSLVFAFIPLSASSSDRLFAFIPLSASSSYRHFFDSRIGDFSKNVIISESQISFRCGILTYMDGMMEDGISRVTIATCGRYTVYIRGRPHLLRDSVRMGPWGRVFWTFGDKVWSHFQKIRRSLIPNKNWTSLGCDSHSTLNCKTVPLKNGQTKLVCRHSVSYTIHLVPPGGPAGGLLRRGRGRSPPGSPPPQRNIAA